MKHNALIFIIAACALLPAGALADVWYPTGTNPTTLTPVTPTWGLKVPGISGGAGCLGRDALGVITSNGSSCGGSGSPGGTSGQIQYNGTGAFAGVATTTLAGTGPVSISNSPVVIGSSGAVITCATATGSIPGCLSAADWTTFNGKVSTTRALTVAGTANQITSSAGSQDLSADRTWTLSFPSLIVNPNASTTLFSNFTKAYFGATATTTIDATGNIVVPSGSGLTNTGRTDGCATWASAVLTSTGVACGSGGGGGIGDPFTHPAAGQSATTSLMLFYGQASTSQLTATSSTYLATVSGNVGIGTASPANKLSVNVGSTLGDGIVVTGTNGPVNSVKNGVDTTMQFGVATAPQYFSAISVAGDAVVNNGSSGSSNGALILASINSNNSGGIKFSTGATNADTLKAVITPAGLFGVGTTTPFGLLSVNPTASLGSAPAFVIGSSSATSFVVASTSRVGIGNNNPATALGLSTLTGSANGISFGAAADNIYRPFAGALQSDANWNLPNLSMSGGIATPSINATNVPLAIQSFRGITTGGQVDTVSLGLSGSNTVTSGNLAQVDIYSNWNNSGGTATNTDFRIQRTETSLSTGKQYLMQVGTSTAINLFNVTNAGLVGLGTSSPFATLSVNGTGWFSGNQLHVGDTVNTAGNCSTNAKTCFELIGNDNSTLGVSNIIQNSNAGTSAYSDLFWQNDNPAGLTNYVAASLNSSGHTDTTFGSAFAEANQFSIAHTFGNILLAATASGKSIQFVAGGNSTQNEVARISGASGGGLGIGSTTPHATLAVNAGSSSPTKNLFEASYSTGTTNNATTTVFSIASSTAAAILLGTSTPALGSTSATSTIYMQKLQFQGGNSAGTTVCAFVNSSNAFSVQAGPCL